MCIRDSHKALRPLAGIMTFKRKANLHDAEAQQDCADGFDGAEHKVAQIVDCLLYTSHGTV